MAKVNVVMPTGGHFPGTTGTTTTAYAPVISGTKYAKIPIKINGVTYYLVVAEDWAWAANTT